MNNNSLSLRPFLLGLDREKALAIINSSRQASCIGRQDQKIGLQTTRKTSSGQTKIYVPFAPQSGDLANLMVPKKPSARCQKCNSNIVPTKVFKKTGVIKIQNFHSGIFNVTESQGDELVTTQMVWTSTPGFSNSI
ncbi:hypothetical protein TWF481_002600 [Arthrobotrys musiformis]|uniref:Uncharacterized protein n=1 Tax=Arthrobotrys musiformis TaxID=47236 RepID=A0AAV9VSN2_9PEZI